ncbi:MAG: hypothetical protein CMK09_06820 [Ponticaulis sp.]|nr:hypothetical protein [Ponticaulis sp.]|tara:strand:+ start:16137 stop:16634 length:498 start_codon:yes stop_codon:yes gene_type:complete
MGFTGVSMSFAAPSPKPPEYQTIRNDLDAQEDWISASERVTISTLGGSWSFETDPYRSGFCQMTGNLTVFPEDELSGTATCQLTAVEVCGQERSVVQQSCTMVLSEGNAVIESAIEQFIERKPSSVGYLPDNFTLNELASDEMSGELDSAVSSFVVFRRPEGGIS